MDGEIHARASETPTNTASLAVIVFGRGQRTNKATHPQGGGTEGPPVSTSPAKKKHRKTKPSDLAQSGSVASLRTANQPGQPKKRQEAEERNAGFSAGAPCASK